MQKDEDPVSPSRSVSIGSPGELQFQSDKLVLNIEVRSATGLSDKNMDKAPKMSGDESEGSSSKDKTEATKPSSRNSSSLSKSVKFKSI